jgi:hypothetical protein
VLAARGLIRPAPGRPGRATCWCTGRWRCWSPCSR